MWKGARHYLTGLDWKRAALQAVCDGGIAAVAVEPLARILGVSKGSFYWHFGGRDELLRAALELWEQDESDAFIASLKNIPDPRERIRQLIVRVSRGSWNCTLHSALSAAADDPIVKPVLQRVSHKRTDYLAECYRALGFAEDKARLRARLGYTIYVGFIHLSREAAGRAPIEAEYLEHILDTMIPADAAEASAEAATGADAAAEAAEERRLAVS